MNGRVVDGRVEAARGERQIVELRVDAREGRVLLIVAAGGEAVQRIAQNVDGDGTVAAQRQAIGQPAVARAQIGDAQRPAKLLLDRRQDAALQVAIALGANASTGLAGVR